MSGYGLQLRQKDKAILGLTISKERNTFVAERFIACLIKTHGKHAVSTDGRTLSPSMQIPKIKASYPFIFREKSDRKNNSIYQGLHRGIWRLLSMCKKRCNLKHIIN
jgi:transposase-like protein